MLHAYKNKSILLVLLLLLFSAFSLYAQNAGYEVLTERIDSKSYPKTRVIVRVEDKAGQPVQSLVKSNFSLRIDLNTEIGNIDLERFAATEIPISYYVLITNSGLMEGKPLSKEKEAVMTIVDAMRPGDTISIFTIGQEPGEIMNAAAQGQVDTALIDAIEVNDTQAKLFDTLIGLDRIIKEDSDKKQLKGHRPVVIVLSDGRDGGSRSTLEEVVKAFEPHGLPIFSIGIRLLGSQYLEALNSLSTGTDGYYHYSSRIDSLSEYAGKILEQVSSAYYLSFKVKGVPADDERHQIMVRVTDKDKQSDSYKYFIAVKVPFPTWLKIVLLVLLIIALAACIVFIILGRRKERKAMGIGKRKCPECGRRMKDDWDFCVFCRYLKSDKKRKKKRDKDS